MAFNAINRNAPASNLPLELKTVLVRARMLSEQMAGEADNIDDAQVASHFGVPNITQAQWETILGDIVVAVNIPAIDTFVEQLG